MKLFKKGYDGGPDSGVTGYWLIELKPLFSVVLLKFSPGSRESFHSHAFNAVTFWLKGKILEEDLNTQTKPWAPSLRPKLTRRNKFHRVIAGPEGAWAISFRGPWSRMWQEYKDDRLINLSNGRVEVNQFDWSEHNRKQRANKGRV
jgi:hypothetical protein